MNPSLIRITLVGMLRRWMASILLIAVAVMGAFAAMLLENLTARQEAALEHTLDNTTILCTVTSERGTDSGRLGMPSSVVEELLDGELAAHITDLRASATVYPMRTENSPVIARIYRILNPDSAAQALSILYREGYDESLFSGREMVCVASPELAGEWLEVKLTELTTLRLRVVGTVEGDQEGTIYIPFFMPYQPGGAISFQVDRCSFSLPNARNLEVCRELLYQHFVVPSLENQDTGAWGLLLHDDVLESALAEVRANLDMLRLLLPVLLVLCGAIGFFAGFLAIRGRQKEFAILRCMGLSRYRVLGLVLLELSLFALLGTGLGIALGAAAGGTVSPHTLGKTAVIIAVFLSGSAVAAWCVTNVNVMKLMKVED